MRKISILMLIIALSLISNRSNAQFLQDNSGVVYRPTAHADVSGNPFYKNDWVIGTVKLKQGQTYKDVSLKFNDYEQFLLFKSPTGAELKFVLPVEEFTFVDEGKRSHFRNLFNGPNSKGGNGFYEVIYDGGIPLYKKIGKDISESTEYGSTGVNKKFVSTKAVYYSIKSTGELLQLKLDKKSIANLFPESKRSQIDTYQNENKIDFKNEDDLKKLFAYCNSL